MVARLNVEPILHRGLIPRNATFRPDPDEAPRGRPLSSGATWTRPPSTHVP
jgi:hypothetical protein